MPGPSRRSSLSRLTKPVPEVESAAIITGLVLVLKRREFATGTRRKEAAAFARDAGRDGSPSPLDRRSDVARAFATRVRTRFLGRAESVIEYFHHLERRALG